MMDAFAVRTGRFVEMAKVVIVVATSCPPGQKEIRSGGEVAAKLQGLHLN